MVFLHTFICHDLKKLSCVKAEKIAGKLMIYSDTHVIYSSSFFHNYAFVGPASNWNFLKRQCLSVLPSLQIQWWLQKRKYISI